MKNIRIIISLVMLVTLLSCSQKDESNQKEIIVAKVGTETISEDDFEASFILNPQYSVRTPVSIAYKSQVKYLIDEKYYYLAAESANLQEDPLVRKRLKYIKDQETLKAFINSKFINKVKVTPNEIKEGIRRIKKQLNVTNFFFSDKDSANAFRKSIVRQKDTKLFNNEKKGTDLDWITYGDLDLTIENELYSLEVGQVSEIVESRYGYHVLLLNDARRNKDVESLPIETLRYNISEIIKKRKINHKVKIFTSDLAKNNKVQINNKIIHSLSEYVNKTMQNREYNPTVLIPPLQNSELINIETNLEDLLDKKIVIFADQKWDVRYFLDRLKEMPPYHRPYLGTKDHLIQSILDIIKSDLLLEEAVDEDFDEDENTLLNYNKYRKEYLASHFKSLLNSKYLKEDDPEKYDMYKNIYKKTKLKNRDEIYEPILFKDIANPDSLITDPPIPVVLKNKYVW